MLIFDMPDCGGCRSCEMACSFHHLGEFKPSVSSIKILDSDHGSPYKVWIITKEEIQGVPCDTCKNIEEPLCLQYCRKKEELEKILKNIKELL